MCLAIPARIEELQGEGMAPVLSFTAEEIFAHLPEGLRGGEPTVFALQPIESAPLMLDEGARDDWNVLAAVRGAVTKAIEPMEIVERHLDLQEQNAAHLTGLLSGGADAASIAELEANNKLLGDDLTSVLTALSFQDITGQRIKKVVSALNQIEAMVVELYVSTGLILDAAEKDPSKNVQELQDEARQAVKEFNQGRSELKGPDKAGASQGAIDDMKAAYS